jgi:hypothetical protein
MPFPLALLPWLPAIAGGTGAAIKGAQRYGPQIVRGATNLANRGLTSLQNVTQPYMQNIANRFMQSNPVSQLFTLDTAARPTESIAYMTAKKIVQGAEWLTADKEKREEMSKNFFEYFGVDMEKALEQAGQELLEEEDKKKIKEPEIPEKKKGGYVKKQRKRKHYRASGFVKMKKKKKYKKKYIKT